ncbi:MAG: hypothetical protein U9P12_02305 [Verrucomicrobiota bacterium]|nr:hypothetical protein [Verrucomicrobiota bacterium]
MSSVTIMLIILAFALAGHYATQKLLLAKGWEAEDPKPQIKRLMINGSSLIIFAVIALVAAEYPFGLFGILLFIEGAVCFAFARKLSRK